MSRECVTHHHACDCREAKFRAFEAAVREIVSGMRNDTAAKPQLGYWADKLSEALQEQAE